MKWFVLNGVTLLDLTLQVLFWAVPVVIVIVVAGGSGVRRPGRCGEKSRGWRERGDPRAGAEGL